MTPSLIIHGGAWNIPDEAVPDCRAGIRRALEAGWKVLSGSGTAIDAVEAAIVILEDDPTFDAGFGSHLNRDGHVQLDAIVMDGKTLKAGAVAAVEHIRNPIRLARLVLEKSEHMMLVAAGAEKFATEHGLDSLLPEELIHPRERHRLATLPGRFARSRTSYGARARHRWRCRHRPPTEISSQALLLAALVANFLDGLAIPRSSVAAATLTPKQAVSPAPVTAKES